MSDTEQELKEAIQEAFDDEELTEPQWLQKPKTVRFEVPLRYMSRMEIRQNLEFIAGQVQLAIMATHNERSVRTMISVIWDELDLAQRENKKQRDIQGERVRMRS